MQTSRAAQAAPALLTVPEVLSIVSSVGVCLRPGFVMEVKVFENGELITRKTLAGMAKRPAPPVSPLEWETETDLDLCGPLSSNAQWR